MIDTNPEGRYDKEKMVEKQVYEKPDKRDVMVDINPEGEHNEEKTVEKQPYEKPEKRDMVADINSEGKYDKEEVDQDEHFVEGDGFEDTEEIKDENFGRTEKYVDMTIRKDELRTPRG
jgi:hypothetical protein